MVCWELASVAAQPTGREDCGRDLLPLGTPGELIKGVQTRWFLGPAWCSSAEWRVQAAEWSEGSVLETVHLFAVGQAEPRSWQNHQKGEIEPNPQLPAGAGKICKTSGAGLTTKGRLFFLVFFLFFARVRRQG